MTRLTMDATLTAAASESRRVTGTLVRWDTPGRTSMGRLSIRRGALTLPDAPGRLRLLYGHDRERPVGVCLTLTETDDGLLGEFLIARTPLGDRYLAELDPEAPIRDGLSVELDDVEIDGPDVAAGLLTAVAAVPLPAYPDSRAALAAELTEGNPMPDQPETSPENAPHAPLTASEPPPVTLNPPPAAPARTAPVSPLALFAERLTEAKMSGRAGPMLAAALADITPAGNGAGNGDAGLLTQALGELWSGVDYAPVYRPHVTGGRLTGTKVEGFYWNPPPTVADYAGNKAAIPSAAAALVFSSVPAERLAGGHDIDRIYRDLGSAEVLASYWREITRSLAVQLDAKAMVGIQNAAGTAIPAGSASEAIVLGTVAVQQGGGNANYALVATDVAVDMATTPAASAPIGAPLTLPPVDIGAELDPGTVIVGDSRAVRQLVLDPPVRVEAVNIPNGGIDAGLFSYQVVVIQQPAAVAGYTVTITP